VTIHPDITDALALRHWARQLLAGGSVPMPSASLAAWRLFLGRERCAGALRTAVGAAAQPQLVSAAERETQQALLLRGELDAVARIAADLGIRPLLMKGGTTLGDLRTALPGKDLDLLLPEQDGLRLLAALDVAGWQRNGGGPSHHFAQRFRPGHPGIEVHAELGPDIDLSAAEAFRRAVPITWLDGWVRLAPADEAWHVLRHATVTHPSHRGRLREHLMLQRILGDLTLQERDALIARTRAGHAESDRATATGLACALDDRLQRETDPFAPFALLWYELERDPPVPYLPVPLRRTTATWAYESLAGEGALGRRLRKTWATRRDGTPLRVLAPLDGVVPRVTSAFRTLLRTVWLVPSFTIGVWRARNARRSARDQRREGAGEDLRPGVTVAAEAKVVDR
jgi:hypothetical protein